MPGILVTHNCQNYADILGSGLNLIQGIAMQRCNDNIFMVTA